MYMFDRCPPSLYYTCAYDAQKCGSDSEKILHKAFVNDLGNELKFTFTSFFNGIHHIAYQESLCPVYWILDVPGKVYLRLEFKVGHLKTCFIWV